jgi:hypothetical protein
LRPGFGGAAFEHAAKLVEYEGRFAFYVFGDDV